MNLTDNLNLVSKLTPRRLVNMVNVFGSYHLSRITRKAFQKGLPVSLSIEPTTSCNLRCPECPSGKREFTRATGMLEMERFKNIIDELQQKLLYLTFYFQGEPYLNPLFLDMVRYAADQNIYTATSTNGHFLNDEQAKKTVQSGLDRLIVSIDGTTQEVYEQYRIGGKLEKVKEGINNMMKWKKQLHSKTPHVIFQFLVVKPNEHQIEDAKRLAKSLKVDEIRFKTAQVYDYEKGHGLIPSIPKYARYRETADGNYAIKNKLLNHCWKLWHSSVITWDGKVVPCCFDKDASHQLGDLNKESFSGLWKGSHYNNFRSAVLRARKEIDICKNCTEGTKVWN